MARLDAPTAESAPSPDSEPCSHLHVARLASCTVEKWPCHGVLNFKVLFFPPVSYCHGLAMGALDS